MNTRLSAVSLAILSMIAVTASAQERGFYVGAELGQSTIDSDKRGLDNSLVAAFDSLGLSVLNATSSVNEDAFTYGLILGYQVLPYLAIEASYIDAGAFEYKARGTVTDGISSVDARLDLDGSAKGPTLSALGILPIGPWSAYGRIGVFFADVDYDVTLSAGGDSASLEPSSSSENFLWGVGAGYSNGEWTTRIEYQQINDLGDNDVAGKADAARIVLGAVHRF
jgi:opacity protein-like surface antigen